MSTETEVKIQIENPDVFERQVTALSPKVLALRHFEDNFLMDFPEKRLQSDRCMLRVRYAKNTAMLTFKGPPEENVLFKIREEIETGLENGEKTIEILESLGLQVWFRYQKYRREYTLGNITISIDETPIGNYVELEGDSSGISDLAQTLHIEKSRFMRHSYYDLYLEACRSQGIQPENMVFKNP